MSRTNTGPISRIHAQAPVVIQCTYDENDYHERWRQKDIQNNPDYHVYPVAMTEGKSNQINVNDLVFQIGSSRVPRSHPLKIAPAVASALNGLIVRKTRSTKVNQHLSDEDLIAELSKGIRFIGVSLHDTFDDKNGNKQKQLSVRVAGTATIRNNSDQIIHIGDIICWAIPKKNEQESLRSYLLAQSDVDPTDTKIRLMTVPMRYENIRPTEVQNMIDQQNQFSREDLEKILDLYHEKKMEMESRKIGKALSFARPGEEFDILLC